MIEAAVLADTSDAIQRVAEQQVDARWTADARDAVLSIVLVGVGLAVGILIADQVANCIIGEGLGILLGINGADGLPQSVVEIAGAAQPHSGGGFILAGGGR